MRWLPFLLVLSAHACALLACQVEAKCRGLTEAQVNTMLSTLLKRAHPGRETRQAQFTLSVDEDQLVQS